MMVTKRHITWRARRKSRLLADGFLPWELRRYIGVRKHRGLCDYPMSRPYIARMRAERLTLYLECQRNYLSKAAYRREIDKLYTTMGWTKTEIVNGKEVSKPDVWAMFRYYYIQSIRLGDYEAPLKKKKKWNKGDIMAQKARWRDKQEMKRRMGIKAPSGDVNDWIRQLEDRLKTETDPDRRRQFEQQIKNLRAIS